MHVNRRTFPRYHVIGADIAPTRSRRILKLRLHALPHDLARLTVCRCAKAWHLERRSDGRWIIHHVVTRQHFGDPSRFVATLLSTPGRITAAAHNPEMPMQISRAIPCATIHADLPSTLGDAASAFRAPAKLF